MPSLLQEAAEVLGVELGADGGPPDAEVIAAAFKKLAMRWHPDRNPENVKEATQRFAEISAARDLLVDPPPAALVDEPARAPPSAGGSSKSSGRTGKSENLRQFVGDVSEQIDSRTLGGKEAVQLFETFALWAVWKCDACAAICCRIRKNKYACMCGHRLRDHDAGHGFRCADLKCDCKRYSFMVQDSTEPHRCRCKHKPSEHESLPPHACTRCPPSACEAFDSPWVCNCGHPPREHKTAFVKHKYAEVRGREPSPNALAPGRWPLGPPRPCGIRSLPSPPCPPPNSPLPTTLGSPRTFAAGTRMGHRRSAWRVRRSGQQVPRALRRRAYGVHRACQRGQGVGSRLLEGHAARGGRPCQVGHRPIATARAACMRRGSYHLAVWCVRTRRRRWRPRTATASGRLRRGRRDACGLRQ